MRIADLPVCDRLRDLRNYHLNGLVRISGVVTRRTGVFPQLRVVKFDCAKCGYLLGPFTQVGEGGARACFLLNAPHLCTLVCSGFN